MNKIKTSYTGLAWASNLTPAWYPHEKGDIWTQTGTGKMIIEKAEAWIGETWPQAKECQGGPEATRSWKRQEGPYPRAAETAWPC